MENKVLVCLFPAKPPAPSCAWLVAGTQCTLVCYTNGECVAGLLLAQLQGAPFTLCSVSGDCERPLCHGSPDSPGQDLLSCLRTYKVPGTVTPIALRHQEGKWPSQESDLDVRPKNSW